MTGAREPVPATPPVTTPPVTAAHVTAGPVTTAPDAPPPAAPAMGPVVPPVPVHHRLRRAAGPWLFLAPALVIFAYFKFIPMAQGMWMSLYEVRPYLGNRFVGGRNYAEVLTSQEFAAAIWHTIVLATGQTFGAMVLGFGLALLLERRSRRIWLIRTSVFLPVVVATAVLVEVWRILYYPAPDGALNTVLGGLGLDPSEYLSSPDSALGSVLVVQIWRQAPYDMMIFLAGLAGVDRSLYEAAAVDGAGRWQRLRHITLPALRPVFAILFVLAAIRGLRVFTEVFLLTGGGPGGATEVIMTLIYKLGLERGELGVASAGSVLLFAATVLLTLLVQLLRRRGTPAEAVTRGTEHGTGHGTGRGSGRGADEGARAR